MKISFIYKTIALALLLSATFSCTDNFDDMNQNPDSTTEAPPAMFATQLILGMTKFEGRDAMAYLEGQMSSKYLGSTYNSDAQYNKIQRGWMSFTNLATIEKMLEFAEKANSPQIDLYRGLAKYKRAVMFWEATANFGDIPYSEAGQAKTGNRMPKYDSQKDVIFGVLKELEEAEALFAKGGNFDGDPTPLNGSADKWRRIVNATRLNILMCLSKKESDSELNIKSKFQNIVSANILLDESTYLGLIYNKTQTHPVYDNDDKYYKNYVLSSVVVDHLKKTNDYRLFYFADPAPAQINSGKTESDMNAYVGCDVSMDNAQLKPEIETQQKYSLINLRYYKEQNSEPRITLNYAMQELIIAEAIVREWITGDAKIRYQNAIKAALKFYMETTESFAHGMPITQAYIDNYFTNPNAAFATTTADQLKQIIMQKFLLGYMQPNNFFTEYRRTGQPEFPINSTTNRNPGRGGGYPMRYQYPDAEYTYNLENLDAALKNQWGGDDDQNNLMWMLK